MKWEFALTMVMVEKSNTSSKSENAARVLVASILVQAELTDSEPNETRVKWEFPVMMMMVKKNPSSLVDAFWEKAELRDSEPIETRVKREFAVMMTVKKPSEEVLVMP